MLVCPLKNKSIPHPFLLQFLVHYQMSSLCHMLLPPYCSDQPQVQNQKTKHYGFVVVLWILSDVNEKYYYYNQLSALPDNMHGKKKSSYQVQSSFKGHEKAVWIKHGNGKCKVLHRFFFVRSTYCCLCANKQIQKCLGHCGWRFCGHKKSLTPTDIRAGGPDLEKFLVKAHTLSK